MKLGRSVSMKRVLMAAGLVASIASFANAGDFNFFVSTGSDAASGLAALTAGLASGANAVLPQNANNVTIALWCAIDTTSPEGTLGFTGGAFDLAQFGGQAWAADLTLSNPPWNGGGNVGNNSGMPAYTHSGFSFNSAGPNGSYPNQGSGPAPLFTSGNYKVWLLGSGQVKTSGSGSLFMELPFGQSVGVTTAAGAAQGVAFGFKPGAGNAGQWDNIATSDDGSGPVPAPGSGNANGFVGDGSVGAIRTTTADATVAPEPATMALLGLGALLIRRRK